MAFFKAYDMRGTFGVDFTLDMIYRIGRWLPAIAWKGALPARPLRVLIGHDARLTSTTIRDELRRGLIESGCAVDDMGMTTTPMVYFGTVQGDYDFSVQITASHNPKGDNGLKVSGKGAVPISYESGLRELETRVTSGELPEASGTVGTCNPVAFREAFIEWLRNWKLDFSGLRFAVDCSDGAAGILARDLFGKDALYINDTPDGNFPNHSPNPLAKESREEIANLVREQKLDAGMIFDGDGDRVMFVDETGDFVQPDYLIPVIARHFLPSEPGATVIYDVRTSRGAIEALLADGAQARMGKVGHTFAKALLRETGAVCGGELAGHYYFRDFFCCDSAELAAIVILAALADAKRKGVSFRELMAPIRKYANSGECNYHVTDKAAATAAVLKAAGAFGTPQARSDIDGTRQDYADGWLCVRESNTEAYLRLIAEAHDAALLKERMAQLEKALEPFIE